MKNFRLLNFIKALLAGAALAVLVFLLGTYREYTVLRRLCDSSFVPAVILLGLSGLRAAAKDGTFDTMAYSIRFAFFTAIPAAKTDDDDLITYKEKKAARRKSPINLVLAGLIYLVLAIIFFVIYLLNR